MEQERKISNPFFFGKCNVCDDVATGIHYGKASCEGCKVYNFELRYGRKT